MSFHKNLENVLFSPNVKPDTCKSITEVFGFSEVSAYKKCLGLPAMIGRKKTEFFHELKFKVLRKLSKWR